MQALNVKTAQGIVQVIVHRSWRDASGAEIFLHANGRYAYRDGSPLRSRDELSIIDPSHRPAALKWWDRTGARESLQFYAARQAQAEARAGDFQDSLASSTLLDATLYTRRAVNKQGKPVGAVTRPSAWMEWFPQRPDWWGQARSVQFAEFRYDQVVEEDDESDDKQPQQAPPAAKTANAQEQKTTGDAADKVTE